MNKTQYIRESEFFFIFCEPIQPPKNVLEPKNYCIDTMIYNGPVYQYQNIFNLNLLFHESCAS